MKEPSLTEPDRDEEEDRFDCAKVNGENGNCPLGNTVTCNGCRYNIHK